MPKRLTPKRHAALVGDVRRNRAMTLEPVQAGVVACERCPRLRSWCRFVAEQRKPEFSGWSYWGLPVPGFGSGHGLLGGEDRPNVQRGSRISQRVGGRDALSLSP